MSTTEHVFRRFVCSPTVITTKGHSQESLPPRVYRVSVPRRSFTRQLTSLVLREANTSLCGPRKIRAKLLSRGYRGEDITSVIDSLLRSGEIDFERSAELLLEKKLTRGATEDEKKAILYKNGYNIC